MPPQNHPVTLHECDEHGPWLSFCRHGTAGIALTLECANFYADVTLIITPGPAGTVRIRMLRPRWWRAITEVPPR